MILLWAAWWDRDDLVLLYKSIELATHRLDCL